MSYSDESKYYVSPHIWFVVRVDENNNIVRLEEHDWREGGSISKDEDLTWLEFFVKSARDRVVNEDQKNRVEKEILSLYGNQGKA